jgi:hypothetical protein
MFSCSNQSWASKAAVKAHPAANIHPAVNDHFILAASNIQHRAVDDHFILAANHIQHHENHNEYTTTKT